jgi:hypothetical protein
LYKDENLCILRWLTDKTPIPLAFGSEGERSDADRR